MGGGRLGCATFKVEKLDQPSPQVSINRGGVCGGGKGQRSFERWTQEFLSREVLMLD